MKYNHVVRLLSHGEILFHHHTPDPNHEILPTLNRKYVEHVCSLLVKKMVRLLLNNYLEHMYMSKTYMCVSVTLHVMSKIDEKSWSRLLPSIPEQYTCPYVGCGIII